MTASLSLEDYLKAALSTLPNSSCYSCRSILGTPWATLLCEEIQGKKVKRSGLAERLIILKQTIKSDTEARNEDTSVFALTAYEGYIEVDGQHGQYITIIDKVDTSGFQEKTAGSKTIIQAYLAWRAQLNDLGNHLVYVFARAQPQYIFRNSGDNPFKHVLSDSQLIRWWKSVLSQSLFTKPTLGDVSKFWLIPGMAQNETHHIDPSPSTDWAWGTAYPQDSIANQVILHLPDDAKSRLVQTDNGQLPVKHFLDILAHSEECGAGRRAGVFYVISVKERCSYPTLDEVLPGIVEDNASESDEESEKDESLLVTKDNTDTDLKDAVKVDGDSDNTLSVKDEGSSSEGEEEEESDLELLLRVLMEESDFSTHEGAINSTKLIEETLDSFGLPVWTASPHPSLVLANPELKNIKPNASGPSLANLLTPRKKTTQAQPPINILTPKRKLALLDTDDQISKKPKE